MTGLVYGGGRRHNGTAPDCSHGSASHALCGAAHERNNHLCDTILGYLHDRGMEMHRTLMYTLLQRCMHAYHGGVEAWHV